MRTTLALSFQEDKGKKRKKKNHLIFFREREKKKIPRGEEIFPDEETVGDKAESVFRNDNLYQYFFEMSLNESKVTIKLSLDNFVGR